MERAPRPCAAPTSGTHTCPDPRSSWSRRRTGPSGISPSKSRYSSGWSSVPRRSGFLGRLGQALRDRPGGERAVALQTQVPVQAASRCARGSRSAARRSGRARRGRLGRDSEVASGAVAPGGGLIALCASPLPAVGSGTAPTALRRAREAPRLLAAGFLAAGFLAAAFLTAGFFRRVAAVRPPRARRPGSPSARSSGRGPAP